MEQAAAGERRYQKSGMKKIIRFLVFLLLAIGISGGIWNVNTVSAEAAAIIPMYSVYNPHTGDQFFTRSTSERDRLVSKGWTNEGVGWYAPETSNEPVYRLYNSETHHHFYTMKQADVDGLKKKGWKYEGIGWYSDEKRLVPVYRQYKYDAKKKTGSHYFTASADEKDTRISKGWRDEGVGWYGVNTNAPVTMEADPGYASVEANVMLNGSGTGYHAKVVIGSTGTGALASFGIQAESSTAYPIAHPNAVHGVSYILEDIMYAADEPGMRGKEYLFTGCPNLNQVYKIRLSWTTDNVLHGYVNNQEIIHARTNMAPPFVFAVEGSARMNGDSVRADFSNIRAKAGNNGTNWGLQGLWGEADEDYFGLKSTIKDPGTVYTAAGPFLTHGKHAYNAKVHIEGTANVPGKDAKGQLWNWDTTIRGLGHPISSIVNIGEYGQ